MPISVDSFLTVERSLRSTLLNAWVEDAAPIADAIAAAADAGDFGRAAEIARQISFEVVHSQQGTIDSLATAAYLLGESFFAEGELGPVGRGESLLPSEVFLAAQALASTMTTKSPETVRLQVLSTLEKLEKEAAGVRHVKEIRFAADTKVADAVNKSVMQTGVRVIEAGANLTTSRLVQFGALNEAANLGIERYRINEVLDNRTCPVCQTMDGEEFEVGPPLVRLQQQLATINLTELGGFPSQSKAGVASLKAMSSGEKVETGWDVPPFHPGCRGVVNPIGGTAGVSSFFTPVLTGAAVLDTSE